MAALLVEQHLEAARLLRRHGVRQFGCRKCRTFNILRGH
jgi:hypothetical protein